jgi:hypothetical protein
MLRANQHADHRPRQQCRPSPPRPKEEAAAAVSRARKADRKRAERDN